ncbi:MAG TPA: LLM class flavin-dependent oxidoreductase, partial [Gemmatimonadaceae bacterium]|nr:LLM class flavin-dependent oxidoreductase [Gemmatimonadaceae bacterium]
DAWSTAAALAAVTERLELMVAVRPTFHNPAILAKQVANLDLISKGRISLNVVSNWWADEARRYGVQFDSHDDRYARTEEWLKIIAGAWKEKSFSHDGKYYRSEDTILSPKPARRPTLYAGGESEAAKSLITRACDAYVMHGDPPDRIAPKVADIRRRRQETGLPEMEFGMAAYAIVRPTEREAKEELARITNVNPGSAGYNNYRDWISHTKLEQQVSLEDYSVSNRGLRAGLVGTPEQVAERVNELQEAGVGLLLLQCSPQFEEMERFAAEVMPLTASLAIG